MTLTSHVELAVSQGREDLAEAAIAQQLDIEAQLPVLEQSIQDAEASSKELESDCAALAAKRREIHAELADAQATGRARFKNRETSSAGHSQQHGQIAELEDLARQMRIRARLAAIKKERS